MSTENRQPIYFVDVTQRDGEQMRIDEVSIEDRIEAFDALASTGIKTFEIGHLGNDTDQAYAKRLVEHVLSKDEYDDISLQVLFGSQSEILVDGLGWLDGFDKNRVIVHVYDRLDGSMRDLASEYYDYHESARRVSGAIDIAYENGFRRFSVSGEGATGSSVGEAMKYYGSILHHCEQKEEKLEVNVNFPSTNGSSAVGTWRYDELESFNSFIKNQFPATTTSMHAHNDFGSAVEFSVQAIRAGFDKVEGTLIGMGERTGNVSLGDVAMRLVEIARAESEPRVAKSIGRSALFGSRVLPREMVQSLSNFYAASQTVAQIYGVQHRFIRTAFGDPEAYNAGCGPHDQASARAIEDPVRWPLYKNYIPRALTDAILGRPQAVGLIKAEPEAIRDITVNGHASGGSTKKIVDDSIEQASSDRREQAEQMARAEILQLLNYSSSGNISESDINFPSAAIGV
ncbi:hypothetical protein HY004_03265 [Candidatus Saccharibacteria bacterium]|nr:hypothetical protein [Candidatus Saccharibacteria bacterium]